MSAKYHESAFHFHRFVLARSRFTSRSLDWHEIGSSRIRTTWHNFTRCVFELLIIFAISVTQIYCSLHATSTIILFFSVRSALSDHSQTVNYLLKIITERYIKILSFSCYFMTVRNHIRSDTSRDITGNHVILSFFLFFIIDHARTVHTLVNKKRLKR